jgi:TonB-linked SusC/RagA family outer membrane protein
MQLSNCVKGRYLNLYLSRQNWLTMKIMAVFLTVFLIHANGRTQTISYSVKDMKLEKVFSYITKQTGYSVLYDYSLLKGTRPVTVEAKNMPLQQFMKQVLQGTELDFTMEDKMIVIQKHVVTTVPSPAIAGINVRGIITDNNNRPLEGAAVKVKGTNKGTLADGAGRFELSDVDANAILIISFTGYASQELKIGGKTNITISLQEKANQLDEVKIIGYGQTSERYATGSVVKISGEEISKQPVTNVLSALSGQAAGVFIQTLNGAPGGDIKVEIRGRQSIAAGTAPLYIIDGISYASGSLNTGTAAGYVFLNGAINPLNNLIPEDIESIEILKDASATAIYGSRAANGVVLITTKKGKAGKAGFSVDLQQGASAVSRYADMLNVQQYLTLRREAFNNAGRAPSADPTSSNYAPDIMVWDTTKSTDWQRYFYGGTAHTTNVQATLTGGNANTHFLFGLNYHNEGSVMPGDQNYRRIGGHFSVEQTSANGKFNALIKTNYYTDENRVLENFQVQNMAFLPPDYPIDNPDGSYNWSSDFNPVGALGQRAKTNTSTLIANAALRYSILPGLNLKANIGYTAIRYNAIAIVPKSAQSPTTFNLNSTSYFQNSNNETIQAEPFVEYARVFGRHKFSILAGSTYQYSKGASTNITGTNYTNEEFMENLSFAGSIGNYSNSAREYKYLSLFGRVSYIGQQKYLLDLNFRRDGSSRFGPGNQYGNFGAVGAGWIFSKEKFIADLLPAISYGKLKLSYGIIGNDQIPDYQYLAYYSNSAAYQGITTLTPGNIYNANYSWESTKKFEIGLEVGLFNDKLLLNTAYYYHRSDNQLVAFPVPGISGPLSSYQANLPAIVQNTGIEFSVNADVMKTKTFSWTAAFNITFLKNKLVAYPDIISSPYANTYTIGEDLSNRRGYHFTGINAQTGQIVYEDINKDGVIKFNEDYVPTGKTSPDFYGGLQNIISFKGFSLSVLLQFVQQHSRTLITNYVMGSNVTNVYTDALGRWQKPGDNTWIQMPSLASGLVSAKSNMNESDAAIVNASYLKLRNASLSYNIPEKLLSRWKLQQVKLFVQAQNLFTISPVKDMDPEVLSGSDTNPIPTLRTIMLGFRITL